MTNRTQQLETAILAGFADGCSLRTMCRKAGISRSAFLKWMHGDPDLTWRYEDAQLNHAEALVDDCLAIADDPGVELGEGRPGDANRDEPDMLRRARFRIDARLKVARIYFKQHEAALARRLQEEELMILAENAEERGDEPATQVAEPTAERRPNRKARRAAKARNKHAPLRLAAVSAQPEPARRVASSG